MRLEVKEIHLEENFKPEAHKSNQVQDRTMKTIIHLKNLLVIETNP